MQIYFSAILCVCFLGIILEIKGMSSVLARLSQEVIWNQLCSCMHRSPEGAHMVTSSAGLKLAETTTSSGTSELRRLSTLLEIPVGTVKSRLHYAKAALRAILLKGASYVG